MVRILAPSLPFAVRTNARLTAAVRRRYKVDNLNQPMFDKPIDTFSTQIYSYDIWSHIDGRLVIKVVKVVIDGCEV